MGLTSQYVEQVGAQADRRAVRARIGGRHGSAALASAGDQLGLLVRDDLRARAPRRPATTRAGAPSTGKS
ncbi:MAG: hypothetical protein MZW92_52750 [Comamonadaceae bacterium]|nr:hypothetical protein [Comamonadaceae bacterium]